MLKNLYIITGASSGLGASISKQLAKKNNHLIIIARNKKRLLELKSFCISLGATVDMHTIDLSKFESSVELEVIFSEINWEGFSNHLLINNASTISPISRLDEVKMDEITNIISLNLTSSIILSKFFMAYSKKSNSMNSMILNISSGVSLNPVEGWGLYCISKSALNMLTAVIVSDTNSWKYPVKSVSINPGPLDTEMQEEIRQSNAEQSPLKNKFVEMFNKGELLSPIVVANKIIKLVSSNSFPNGEYIDLKSFDSE
ncbi:SDR family NAD(P)-dependent oxidoreductase [Candidatus Pseudothioglobus sp. Uisw_050_01]|uniref:SDR family NAD(P)-dependent oxidoreductase n=1 Tax=Candidatus Pseudothioglobus sp. Uisw_050_01 TaxID=3230997 RepID=UPI003A89784D